MQRYREIHDNFDTKKEYEGEMPGSVRALITSFKGSAEFKELKPNVQRMYLFYMDMVAAKVGKFPAKSLKSRHVLEWQDALAETPAKANNIMAAISRVYAFGKRRGMVDHNPATGVKKLKVGEWRAWRPEEIVTFGNTVQGPMRFAFQLALYTGQRLSDIIKMRWDQIVDGGIEITQQKTGAKLWVPIHTELWDAIQSAAWKRKANSEFLLISVTGHPYKADHLKHQFKEAMRAAGLPEDCVFHGLRKTAAALLAEAGCTTEQIKAITGHRTDQMAAYYSKQANQRVLARAAIEKLEAKIAQPPLRKLPNPELKQ